MLVWHRRAGKDLFALNYIIYEMFRRPGLYWHVFPTYRQGRNAIWLGSTRDGRRFLDHFPLHDKGVPNDVIVRKRDDEMTLWLQNGATYQVVGADDPDRLVGANPVGVVFSEWSLMDPNAWELIRPILAENDGWAIFIYTPRGRNHGYKTLQDAYSMMRRDPSRWFAQVQTVDDTGAVPKEVIEEDRLSGMAEEMVQQEYWCSFDAPLAGSYYGELMVQAMVDGRIHNEVVYDPLMPVETWWDLGVGDRTAIWFVQQPKHGGFRHIDFIMRQGLGLPAYLNEVARRRYLYSRHLVPHDAQVKEWGTGKTRIEQAQALGFRFEVVPKLSLEDGIAACRSIIPVSWFNEDKCAMGITAMQEYTKKPTGERDPEGRPIFEDAPLKNWATDPADAFRTGAVGHRRPRMSAGPTRQLAPKLPIV